MDTRRDFLKKAIILSGATGISGILPVSIQRAMAIDPEKGSTYLDAEHVVILMQENRAFDHCFGTLKGVRGYNDPRAVELPNGHPVWLQVDGLGRTYAPFRLNIRDTKATWMGSLPHGRMSQVDAWNYGKYDKWLIAKRSAHADYANMPLTLGYYNRDDLPFNHALADAFTICDQNFCSLMGPTTPNRSFFWTGTVNSREDGWVKANMSNSDYSRDYAHLPLNWKTFPEVLEDNGITWKFYQNDLYCGDLMTQEERDWLLNFGCNILEFWSAYHVKFSSRYVQSLKSGIDKLRKEIEALKEKGEPGNRPAVAKKKLKLNKLLKLSAAWSRENFDKLSPREKDLYKRAFVTNAADPDYRKLTTFRYDDHGTEREVTIPRGDTFYQFRKDVENGNLATVTWMASPKYFSDHPTVPWYGSWYTSQVLDILTQNPEVWKKTIFILTYDENDGYFDHVPPFSVPDPRKPGTGKASSRINLEEEWSRLENQVRSGLSRSVAREAPIGLGFRVPMIIASPWSRGGKVCSQVFDHTSTLQFLETFLNRKWNKRIRFDNISAWRRTICGDLTAVFAPFENKRESLPFLDKDKKIREIYSAQFKQAPSNYKKLSREEMRVIAEDPYSSDYMPKQEPGVKSATALPYELRVDGRLNKDKFEVSYAAGDKVFGKKSAGAPFTVYSYRNRNPDGEEPDRMRIWQYAVAAGDTVKDSYPLSGFEQDIYQLTVHGPNGFLREFRGNSDDPHLIIKCDYERENRDELSLSGNIKLLLRGNGRQPFSIEITDNGYRKSNNKQASLGPGENSRKEISIQGMSGWYDFTVQVKGYPEFKRRYAGRIETGKESCSDPVMGHAVERSA